MIHEPDLHLIAIGTGILGAGGGGSPERAKLKALLELRRWAGGLGKRQGCTVLQMLG